MLDPIGEPAVRMTMQNDTHQAVEQKEIAQKKIDKAVEERPIESSEGSEKPNKNTEKKTGGYNLDDKGVFFEKYDKDGNVIFRSPPEKKPIDQHA
jgi:hypothetical protein